MVVFYHRYRFLSPISIPSNISFSFPAGEPGGQCPVARALPPLSGVDARPAGKCQNVRGGRQRHCAWCGRAWIRVNIFVIKIF
jgi:hypothetical protein